MEQVWTIVVAAGTGTRFGGAKQYERLGDQRVLDWSLATARRASDGVVLVVAPDRASDPEDADQVVVGGASRSASVRAGLAVVPADVSIVLVHDAARPLATATLFADVITAVRAGADAAVPVVPVVDTLRRRDGGTVDRDALVAVQTPQGFRAGILRAAHHSEPDATDDASLVEAAGGRVVLVDGEPENRKVTTSADLRMLTALCSGREQGAQ